MGRRVIWSISILSIAVLCSVLQAETPECERVWNDEYKELAGQIARLKNWRGVPRDRLKAETLDQQALTQPEDKDPLDIVLRQTGALLQHFKKGKQLSSSLLGEFEAHLGELSAAAKETPDAAARKDIFIEACKLRRKIDKRPEHRRVSADRATMPHGPRDQPVDVFTHRHASGSRWWAGC